MNATTVSGIKLKVSISRNQPIEFGDKGVTPWNAIGKYSSNTCKKYKYFILRYKISTYVMLAKINLIHNIWV